MAQSQRVLSGSRTRGSTATPSGSIIYSYQGIYAKSDASFFGSLLPRLGSGNRLKLYKGSKPVSDTVFDDSISINNDTADMPGGEDEPLSVRVSFDLEMTTLGQAPTTQQGDKFVDIGGFNPVAYIEDPGNIMWPVNLWNVGTLPEHAFDGVIEPLDIKAEILGLSGRYSGHKVRGAIMGSFADSDRGGRKIRDIRHLTANPPQPFFDGPNQVRSARKSPGGEAWTTGSVPVSARLAQSSLSASAWTDPTSILPLQSYQGLYDEVEPPWVDKDYFTTVYSKLIEHNPQSFRDTAAGQVGVYDLNSSWRSNTNPKYLYSAGAFLVSWWRMKTDVSTTGNMPNFSDYNFEGIFGAGERPDYNNATYPGYPETYIAASCADFNGSTDFMKATGGSSGASFDNLIGGSYSGSDLKAWSFSCWIMVDDWDTDTRMMIMNVGSADYARSIGVAVQRQNGATEGYVTAMRYGAGSWILNSANSTANLIVEGEWTHIIVTYAGTFNPELNLPQFGIYVNGLSRKDSETGQGSVSDAPDNLGANYLNIGRSPNDRNYFNGKISDCAIWNRVLNFDERLALYNMASAGPASATQDWVTTENTMSSTLRLMSSSLNESIDPLNERSNHGFYFGKKAGSIVYGDW